MATLYVHHKVADYGQWRGVYDALRAKRQEYGETGERVLRAVNNPNELMALVEFGTADQARAWATSSDLKEGMKNAGVVTQPDILILEEPTDALTITSRVLQAIEAQDFDAARALLSDDFQFSGATPVPVTGDQWLAVHRALAQAMPDFSFHYKLSGGENDKTEGTVQVGGTHTGTFNPPLPGLPSVPPTGKKILNPTERVWVTAQNGKLTSWEVEHLPNGGVVGILSQMGVTIPG